MTSQDSDNADQGKKPLYQRYQDAKRGKPIPEEDLKKYTGMSMDELKDWAKDMDGVAGNQAAGKLNAGPASGFAGYEAAHGVGGWGTDAKGVSKFPPQNSKE
ncbi:hypothetical protein N8I77_005108 [Diaporthe amygdali]|uniref:Uncharacterized protein n=1 Tax=Phomopsis amygdali TaxID=1214568 RepID=A0AAD9W6K8_PHOAM|nr:hypothetical protein N8I77_005108 [Diaporthe amygdali]